MNDALFFRELVETQGDPVDVDGYYRPDVKKANGAIYPSKTLNAILTK